MCYEYNKLEWEREMDESQRAEPGDVAAEPEVQPTNVPGHKPESEREVKPVTWFEKERLLSSLK